MFEETSSYHLSLFGSAAVPSPSRQVAGPRNSDSEDPCDTFSFATRNLNDLGAGAANGGCRTGNPAAACTRRTFSKIAIFRETWLQRTGRERPRPTARTPSMASACSLTVRSVPLQVCARAPCWLASGCPVEFCRRRQCQDDAQRRARLRRHRQVLIP
jgi:hypothetical protein